VLNDDNGTRRAAVLHDASPGPDIAASQSVFQFDWASTHA
jgi:hypothetical protein